MLHHAVKRGALPAVGFRRQEFQDFPAGDAVEIAGQIQLSGLPVDLSAVEWCLDPDRIAGMYIELG